MAVCRVTENITDFTSSPFRFIDAIFTFSKFPGCLESLQSSVSHIPHSTNSQMLELWQWLRSWWASDTEVLSLSIRTELLFYESPKTASCIWWHRVQRTDFRIIGLNYWHRKWGICGLFWPCQSFRAHFPHRLQICSLLLKPLVKIKMDNSLIHRIRESSFARSWKVPC